jgi:hypothetical protein
MPRPIKRKRLQELYNTDSSLEHKDGAEPRVFVHTDVCTVQPRLLEWEKVSMVRMETTDEPPIIGHRVELPPGDYFVGDLSHVFPRLSGEWENLMCVTHTENKRPHYAVRTDGMCLVQGPVKMCGSPFYTTEVRSDTFPDPETIRAYSLPVESGMVGMMDCRLVALLHSTLPVSEVERVASKGFVISFEEPVMFEVMDGQFTVSDGTTSLSMSPAADTYDLCASEENQTEADNGPYYSDGIDSGYESSESGEDICYDPEPSSDAGDTP